MPQIKYYNSITLLKVCATFLITWFHLKPYAPDFLQPIFIGGALGNSLFFFASGFLIKIKDEHFTGEWILHKYIRIMPSVWIATLLTFFVNKSVLWYEWIYPTHFWFVNAILCFFFVYWCFHQWINKNPIKTIFIVSAIHVIWYLINMDYSTLFLDAGGIKSWFYNFILFLSGHYTANYFNNVEKKIKLCATSNKHLFFKLSGKYRIPTRLTAHWVIDLCISIICITLFYGYKMICSKIPSLCFWQFLIMPIILFLFTIFSYKFMQKLASIKVPNFIKHILSYISNMTLDIYVVQIAIIILISKWNLFFPLNIIVMLLCIAIAAYFCYIISNKISKLITKKLIH